MDATLAPAALLWPLFQRLIFWTLSTAEKTRQTRHLGRNPLIPLHFSMSGWLKFPDIDPTKSGPEPDKRSAAGPEPFSESSKYSKVPRETSLAEFIRIEV